MYPTFKGIKLFGRQHVEHSYDRPLGKLRGIATLPEEVASRVPSEFMASFMMADLCAAMDRFGVLAIIS